MYAYIKSLQLNLKYITILFGNYPSRKLEKMKKKKRNTSPSITYTITHMVINHLTKHERI